MAYLRQQAKDNIKRYIDERKLASKNDEIILVVRRLGQTGNISSEGEGKAKARSDKQLLNLTMMYYHHHY